MDDIEYSYELRKGSVTRRGTMLQRSERYAVRSVRVMAATLGTGAKWRVWSGKWERKGVGA